MHNSRFKTLLASVLLLLPYGESRADDSTRLDYPELMVSPRASERLQLEAKDEADRRWVTQLPVQISALSNLVAGFIQLENVNESRNPGATSNSSGFAGIAVGGAWLATTFVLATRYEPYQSGWSAIKSRPARTPREQLERERFSEEEIESAARLGARLRWLSFGTNAVAAGYMLGVSNKNSFSPIADGIALAFSFAPVLFPYRWETVANEQETYKKKIYGPIAGLQFGRDYRSGSLLPGAGLTFQF